MSVINTNVPALIAQRNLNTNQLMLSKSIERLSSGLRINRAADDAAGLSISEKLRAQIRGTTQAIRNTQDGVSMVQTAEGALNEIHAIVQRMRELAVQAANGSLASEDRDAINAELTLLSATIDKIADSTQFNKLKLLNGELSVVVDDETLGKVDPTSNEFTAVTGLFLGQIGFSGAKSGYTYSIVDNADGTITMIENDGANDTRSERISVRGMVANDAQMLNFGSLGISIQLQTDSTFVAEDAATIAGDLDTATTTISGGGSSVTIQAGANNDTSEQIQLAFIDMDSTALGITSTDVSTQAQAQTLIVTLDAALISVSTQRAELGAKQNQLEHTIANLTVANENLTASESRIRDLDVAAETVNFTKNQIIQQAGTAVLAQANTLPQNVLSLLRG
ncbi:MAG: flagellin [Chloroflexi bacterium]|nr:flagellin [Chloroflexota bacterium]